MTDTVGFRSLGADVLFGHVPSATLALSPVMGLGLRRVSTVAAVLLPDDWGGLASDQSVMFDGEALLVVGSVDLQAHWTIANGVDLVANIGYELPMTSPSDDLQSNYLRHLYFHSGVHLRARTFDMDEEAGLASTPWWVWTAWGTYAVAGAVMAATGELAPID